VASGQFSAIGSDWDESFRDSWFVIRDLCFVARGEQFRSGLAGVRTADYPSRIMIHVPLVVPYQ